MALFMQAMGTSRATAPIADLGNQSWTTGWTSSSSSSTGSGSTAAPGNDFNPRALSEAVWGSGYTPKPSGSSAVEPFSGSTGNLMTDFLLDRGNFTPKVEDESEG